MIQKYDGIFRAEYQQMLESSGEQEQLDDGGTETTTVNTKRRQNELLVLTKIL